MDAVYKYAEKLSIDMNVIPVINYALQQNDLSFVQAITFNNKSENDLENIEVRISSDPEFVAPFNLMVEYIPKGKNFVLRNVPIRLNATFLAGLTERVKGTLTVSAFKEDNLIVTESVDVTALAFDEWHGYGYYPELLTSFVTPNHPEIVKIIARASEILKGWTGDPSMDAYQTQDPNRVLNQAAAIFNAIKDENIIYSVPPASFEVIGQRVRLCDTVLQQKFGTCLDLTLLYASCLESVGLHPIMIITKGHIFSGVWLEELSFPETIQDDTSVITKRLADGVNEIAVIETTLVVNGKNATFDDARTAAEHTLLGTEPIECIVDVYRSRISGIRPLPQRVHSENGWIIEHKDIQEKNETIAPTAINNIKQTNNLKQEENAPKIVQWERKLLDLGLRNNLINLRPSKTLLPMLTSSLDDLEDALSSGNDFSILPKPNDWDLSGGYVDFETIHDLGAYANVIKSEFENKRLRSIYTDAELTRTVKGLYRTSKTSLEENGANTLYLAMGILRWYETARSTKPRYAPVVLIPVEIIRKSANKGFIIRLRDDEPQMNITILEKIKQDFGITVKGIDPLPTDEKGVDLRSVFTVLRKAIMEQPRWDVLESAYLGIFSFSQFVMWNDLRNRTNDLLKNKIVKSLTEGKLSWEAKPMEIGERVPEDNVLLPMSADASQLYAIEAACNGESFVLHGPPGTGKSQTITSLIANALSQGKSVLFVAEKMAALEVVQKRLESIGVGPFCLELHSNKSKKKDVLEQLRRASEVTKYQSAEEFSNKVEQIRKLRSDLDSYAQQLHKKQNCGYTLHELINDYENYRNAPDISTFDRDFVKSLTSSALSENTLTIERLVAAGKSVGHPHKHPLSEIKLAEYSQQLRTDLQQKLTEYKQTVVNISDVVKEFSQKTNFGVIDNFSKLETLFLIAKELCFWFEFPVEWAKIDNLSSYLSSVKEMAEHYKKVNSLRAVLLQDWNEMFLQQDAQQLLAEYNEISSKWFISKIAGMNQFCKKLAIFSLNGISKEQLGNYITALYSYQTEYRMASQLFSQYGEGLGNLYQGAETDWQNIVITADAALRSSIALVDICGNDEMRSYRTESSARDLCFDLVNKYNELLSAKNATYTMLALEDGNNYEDWLDEQINLCDNILANSNQIKEWLAYKSICLEAQKLGLSNVVVAYESGLNHEDVLGAYNKSLLYVLIAIAIDENSALNSFSGAVFNEKIEQYKRIDKELATLSQEEIYCRLASNVPNFVTAAAHSSELGILQRMIKSGGRGTSIRKLFEDIPNLLPRLCPCMLMSPISAAQYLDPKREPFDIVVFDEASQLPTCKAVGVLARGKDAVIVGDPKQMPPTSFFATNTVDEDNLEIEDLESILDDCLALNMPETHLLWHYRSRHESLIAFSNNQFYENKLYTFPSVNDRESKVSLVSVNGVFERGKTRRNKAEAEAIIDELKRRCHDTELSKQSVGVVTFNTSQQHLIDDLLGEACETDSDLEKWVYESEEPLFIKNLENVQGDERDVILFSIGYGPDESGKVYMNFGPLNRDGGWRRLNVAVSRARNEMIVFSTLKPDQINLSRTSAEGVAALKAFLEYAAGNELSIDSNTSTQYRADKEGIAKAISVALAKEGYETEIGVGHSEYRIDVGIVDPKNPEKYLLGLLLDGSSYSASKTTRDRELAQVSVLSGLGWEIMRIWTMDWWDNSEKELERIISKLNEIKNGVKKEIISEEKKEKRFERLSSIASVFKENYSSVQAAPSTSATPYIATNLNNTYALADDFISGWRESDIIQSIQLVLATEAPISQSLLTKRVVQSFGIARSGSRIQSYMDILYARLNLTTTTRDGEKFYWCKGQTPSEYKLIRATGIGDNKRDTKDVPTEEAVNAVCQVLEQQVSLSEEDLIKESAKLMGYTRMGNVVVSLFESAIKSAMKTNRIKKAENGNFVL